MPRSKKLIPLETRIAAIISNAASAIGAVVREDMTSELQQLLAGRTFSKVAAGNVGRLGRRPGGAGQKRNIPKSCVYPNCSNASKGPRWSFLCDKHKGVSKAERKKLLVQWKTQQASGKTAEKTAPSAKKKKASVRGDGKKSAAVASA